MNKNLTNEELAKFYKSLNHESEVKSKLNIDGYDNTAIEFKEMPGVWFLKTRNGMKLYSVQLNIQRII